MDVGFDDADLDRLEIDSHFTAGLSAALVKAYRKRMQAIRAAVDERDLYSQRSLNLEKLKGKRKGQYSLRLNDQYRLVVRLEAGNPSHESKRIVIVGIEDYH